MRSLVCVVVAASLLSTTTQAVATRSAGNDGGSPTTVRKPVRGSARPARIPRSPIVKRGPRMRPTAASEPSATSPIEQLADVAPDVGVELQKVAGEVIATSVEDAAHRLKRSRQTPRRTKAELPADSPLADDDDVDETAHTVRDRVADRSTAGFGTFTAMGAMLATIVGWIGWQELTPWVFDPFPYGALTLLLSIGALVSLPMLLISQKRGEQIDRARAKKDYKVDRQTALAIDALHIKVDELRNQIAALVVTEAAKAQRRTTPQPRRRAPRQR